MKRNTFSVKHILSALLFATGFGVTALADSLDIDLTTAEMLSPVEALIAEAYAQSIASADSFDEISTMDFTLSGSVHAEKILFNDDAEILKVDFDSNAVPLFGQSVLLMRKNNKVQILFYYNNELFELQSPMWNGHVATFNLESQKYCIDVDQDLTDKYESDFYCSENDDQATRLTVQDGFYVFASVYPDSGGYQASDTALDLLRAYMPEHYSESAACILFDDKRINIDSGYWKNKPFLPYRASGCPGSVGALAGPFMNDAELEEYIYYASDDRIKYQIVFCRNQTCSFDFEEIDTTIVPEPVVSVNVELNWADPGFQAALDIKDVFFYRLTSESDDEELWWTVYKIHSFFTDADYLRVTGVEDEEYYQQFFFSLPGKVEIPPGRYMVSAKATLNPPMSDYETVVSDMRIVDVAPGEDTQKIIFNFVDENIERACPFVYSIVDGVEVQQGEIIKMLVGSQAEATQELPVQFTVVNGIVTLTIREEKYETSYIDWLELSVNGQPLQMLTADERLNGIDGNRFVLKQGEEILVQFQVPEYLAGQTMGILSSHGYYVPD